jgi:hypothetical protein
MKLSKKELIEMIREEAKAIKGAMINESDAVEDTVEALDVDMNQNDGLGDSEKALTYKDKSKKVEKAGPTVTEPKMNAQDNDQGSDEDAAVAVKVDAGAKKGGSDHTAGQAKANFTSKKKIQDTSASGPFDDRVSDSHEMEMNKEDKLVDEKAKTYVSAGGAKGGKTHTAGQHKAEVHERIPEKEVEEKEDRIAKGIEIDGSNIDLKESYTKDELKSFIMSEAVKAVANHIDNEKKSARKSELEKELETIKESLENLGSSLEVEE